jgi:hypothetical protein
MASIHKGYCPGCPYDYGNPLTETAYNLGCLPGIGEIEDQCDREGRAWACHETGTDVCCGYAAANKAKVERPPLWIEGIHPARDDGATEVETDAQPAKLTSAA